MVPRPRSFIVLVVALCAGLFAFATSSSSPAAAAPAQAAAAAPIWGSPYWRGWDIARGVTTEADGTGGYVLDGWGGLHPFAIGANWPPAATRGAPYWRGWDIARSVALLPSGTGGYVLDGWGGVHPFAVGSNPMPPPVRGAPYWRGWDIARGIALLPSGTGGYVLDGWGGLHPFTIGSHPTPPPLVGGPYWPGTDAARDITLLPGGGALVLDGEGRTYDAAPLGGRFPGRVPDGHRWPAWDIAEGISALPGGGAVVLDGWGGLHRYAPPSTTVTNYAFVGLRPDGSPFRYDPCTPIHYVVNAASAPPGGVDLVHAAVAQVSALTGLRFVYDGLTWEAPISNRPVVNTALYGSRIAPVLVAWSNPAVVPSLGGGVAGVAGSVPRSDGSGVFLTGLVYLDGPQLGGLLNGFGPGITRGDVVLHELMHVVGLTHVNEARELMFPSTTTGPAVAGLGDRAGLRRLGTALGCTPRAASVVAAGDVDGVTALAGDWLLDEFTVGPSAHAHARHQH